MRRNICQKIQSIFIGIFLLLFFSEKIQIQRKEMQKMYYKKVAMEKLKNQKTHFLIMFGKIY